MKERVVKDITNECATFLTRLGFMVYYRDVPLWSTIYPHQPCNVNNLSIKLMEYLSDEDDDEEETSYSILGLTPVIGLEDMFDYSTYGDWENLDAAVAWLGTPVPLY